LLFLKKDIGNVCYPVGEPWQFQLQNGKAQIQTVYKEKQLEKFMALTKDELLKQAREAS
jgi:hypothetical protein